MTFAVADSVLIVPFASYRTVTTSTQGNNGDVMGQRGTRLSWTKHQQGGKFPRKEGDYDAAEVEAGWGRVGVVLLQQRGVMVHNKGFTTINKGNVNCVGSDEAVN